MLTVIGILSFLLYQSKVSHIFIDPASCVAVHCLDDKSRQDSLTIFVDVQKDYYVSKFEFQDETLLINIDNISSHNKSEEGQFSKIKGVLFEYDRYVLKSDRGFIKRDIPILIDHLYEHSLISAVSDEVIVNQHRSGGIIIDPRG